MKSGGKRAGRRIQDEFSELPVSRQRKWQLRQAKRGLCAECNRAVASGGFCLEHLVERRELARKKLGCSKRVLCRPSYQMEEEAKRHPAVKRKRKSRS